MTPKPFRADGGGIGTGRIREIADNPYGDEEKCWLAQRVLALLDELEENDEVRQRLANAEHQLHTAELAKHNLRASRKAQFRKRKAAEKRIAELERSETQLIEERDNAESALNDAYKAVMGQAPEWSNWFSFADAIDEIELACGLWRNQTDDVIQFRARIAELESREVTLPAQKYCPAEYAGSVLWGETEVWNQAISECAKAIRAAGIGKGE